MKYSFTLFLVWAIGGLAQAQTTIQFGPRVGGTAASASYMAYDSHKFAPDHVLGAEVGGTVQARRAHWALQDSGLYSQKGFKLQETYQPASRPTGTSYQIKETYRLNYLTLPVNVAYTQHANGQGLQVFAGGYVGLLLNGRWKYDDKFLEPQSNGEVYGYALLGEEKEIPPRQTQLQAYPTRNDEIYSRRIDAGVQAGVGYSYAHLLVQGTYSLGLVNLAPTYSAGTLVYAPSAPKAYKNNAAQLSVTYLFGSNE